MPLPLGIKTIRPQAAALIPWAWGVNGATSVFGSVLAVSLAINFGYNALLLVGAGIYILAAIVLPATLARGESRVNSEEVEIPDGVSA